MTETRTKGFKAAPERLAKIAIHVIEKLTLRKPRQAKWVVLRLADGRELHVKLTTAEMRDREGMRAVLRVEAPSSIEIENLTGERRVSRGKGQYLGRKRTTKLIRERPGTKILVHKRRQGTGVSPAAYEPDIRSRLLVKGREIAEADLKTSGGAYDLDQVRMLLGGITRQAVAKKVEEGALLAVEGPERARRYPTVQFGDDGRPVAGLKEVVKALPTRNSWIRLNWLVRPERRLEGRRPIDVLKEGRIADVVAAAKTLYEQGAH